MAEFGPTISSRRQIQTHQRYRRYGAWHLHWFDIQQSRLLDEQYWFDKGDFFEAVWLDDDGHWKCGKKLTKGDAYKEMCMREAMNIWESEERDIF